MNAENVTAELQGFVCRTAGLDELPFLERWRTVWYGLRQPVDSGEYKFARLQILRLSAVVAAALTPCLAVLLIFLCALLGFRAIPEIGGPVKLTPPDVEAPPVLEDPPQVKPFDPNPTPTEDVPPLAMGLALTPVVTEFGAPLQQNVSRAVIAGLPATTKAVPSLAPTALVGDRPGLRLIHGSPHGTRDGSGEVGVRRPNEDAIFRALRWLKANQSSDGSWNNVKPAMTALAVLAFLGHGETPASVEFGDTVRRGVEWLVDNQEADGHFKGRDPHDYSQPIVTYALCEATMFIKAPEVRYAAERALEVVLVGQHADGAWDYNCKRSERRDTSYMGWCVQAVKSASLAGVGDADRLEKASRLAVAAMKRQYGGGGDGSYGGFGYTGPDAGRGGLTGVGVLSLELLHAGDSAEAQGGLRTIEQWKVDWAAHGMKSPLYYWYYGVQAAFHAGGSVWKKWDAVFADELVKHQTTTPGTEADKPHGYWDSPAQSEHHDGRVMDTSLCVLMLEVYYRYLPIYNIKTVPAAAPAAEAEVARDMSIDVRGI